MDPFESLLTQQPNSGVNPEVLEMLGRQASQLFQQKGISLNDAIAQVVANHPELGNEHLNRIVEFANTVTFQEMFQNSEDKNVHFDVADPGVVMRDIKDGGTPAHDGKTLSNNDYAGSPKVQQAGFPEADQLFTQQFTSGSNGGTTDIPKVASETYHGQHANPIDDVHDLKLQAEATRDALIQSYEMADLLLKTAKADFYHQVKVQILDPYGAGLGGILGALEKTASKDEVWIIIRPIVEELVKEGVSRELLSASLEKRAGKIVNLQHPIIGLMDAMTKIANDMATTAVAIDELSKSIDEINEFYKTSGALTTGVKNVMKHKGAVPSGIRQRFPRE